MIVLALDTTADICSLCLSVDDKKYTFHESRPRLHAKVLLPEIQNLLTLASVGVKDLDLIVFGRGPGSFTGVRIATAATQGLALSASCDVLPVSTLQSLAWRASSLQPSNKRIWAALDARMSEIYFAEYEIDTTGIPVLINSELVIPPAELIELSLDDTTFIGNGWMVDYKMPESLEQKLASLEVIEELPHASDHIDLALALLRSNRSGSVAPENALPVYLRDNVTWDNKPKIGS